MYKYLLCIVIGILVFILLNRVNGFSIGIPSLNCSVEIEQPVQLIDPSIPYVDLTNIVEDSWLRGPNFENDNIANTDASKMANFADLPCKLKVSASRPLKFVSLVIGGSSGIVYKYSTDREYTEQDDYVTIAVKKYTTDQTIPVITGQNDPEINIIRSMEQLEADQGLKGCEIVDARILLVGTRPFRKYVCIMEYMDGTILSLWDPIGVDPNAEKILIRPMAITLRCISNAGYCYTDLKLENILYKRRIVDETEQIIYILGDLGSIVSKLPPTEFLSCTYPSPEYAFGLTDFNNTDNQMIWNIGVLTAILYIDVPIFYRGTFFKYSRDNPNTSNQQLLDTFYERGIGPVIQELESMLVDDNAMEIIRGTLARPEDRISFDRIIDILQ